MHVLRISPALYREGTWPVAFDPVGGLQVQVWRITEQFSRMGIEQTVLTCYIPGSPRLSRPFAGTVVRSVGPWLPRLLGRWFLNFNWFLGVLPELVFRADRYDVAHVHFNHSVWSRMVVLIAKARGLPTVVSMNTALWGALVDAFKLEGKPYDLAAIIERKALSTALRVLSLTRADIVEKVHETGLDLQHFEVIPDAIDLGQFGPPAGLDRAIADFRFMHGIPEDARVVTYVGRISAEKGWQDLPRCLEQVLDSRVFLLVCGDGTDREKLTAALRQLNRPDAWCITGFLSPEEVRVAMRSSDVLLLPSRREAFGGVLLEAMASELPAVAYAVGGIAEVAGEPPAIRLVEAGSTQGLVDAIREVLGSDALRSELVARGGRRVRDFSIDTVAEATLAVYRSVARQRNLAPARQLESDPN